MFINNHLREEVLNLSNKSKSWDEALILAKENREFIHELRKHNDLHHDARLELKEQLDAQNKILTSICTNVSSMLEIVSFVKNQKSALETIRNNIVWIAPGILGIGVIITALVYGLKFLQNIQIIVN